MLRCRPRPHVDTLPPSLGNNAGRTLIDLNNYLAVQNSYSTGTGKIDEGGQGAGGGGGGRGNSTDIGEKDEGGWWVGLRGVDEIQEVLGI